MAEFLTELEDMALNAATSAIDEYEPEIVSADVARWQHLFKLSSEEATAQIKQYRNDIGRSRISDELWNTMKEAKEAEGFDRESYEFSLTKRMVNRATMASQSAARIATHRSYILKLEGPFGAVEDVACVACLSKNPQVTIGTGDTGDAAFCKIDDATREKLLRWIADTYPDFRPTIVRLSRSPKELDSHTYAPALGFDTTLPQHRLETAGFVPLPQQDQYPVWYFVYGNLANPDELQQRLNLDALPEYLPAWVYGGKLRSWRGLYRALVDAGVTDRVDGKAYLVKSREHEEILQFYETEKYEVVRCKIHTKTLVLSGLVFRFVDTDEGDLV